MTKPLVADIEPQPKTPLVGEFEGLTPLRPQRMTGELSVMRGLVAYLGGNPHHSVSLLGYIVQSRAEVGRVLVKEADVPAELDRIAAQGRRDRVGETRFQDADPRSARYAWARMNGVAAGADAGYKPGHVWVVEFQETKGVAPESGTQVYDFSVVDAQGERILNPNRVWPSDRGDRELRGRPFQIVEHPEHLRWFMNKQMRVGENSWVQEYRVIPSRQHAQAFQEYALRRSRGESAVQQSVEQVMVEEGGAYTHVNATHEPATAG